MDIKKSYLAFVFIFIFLISIAQVSAWDWDNVKEYDEVKREYTITNALGLGEEIAKVRLDSDPVFKVIDRGYKVDQLVAEMTIDNADDVENWYKQMDFYNIKEGMKPIDREFKFKYKVQIGTENIPIIESNYECTIGSKDCVQEITGYINNPLYEWRDLDEKALLQKGTITIGIFTDVKPNENIEWIPVMFGETLSAFAEWSEGLTQITYAYFNMSNPTASSNTVFDVAMGRNGAIQTPKGVNWSSSGVLGQSWKADDDEWINNADSFAFLDNTYANYTMDLWIANVTAGTRVILTYNEDNSAEPNTDIYVSYDGSNLYFIYGDSDEWATCGVGLNTGQWVYITLIRNTTHGTVYINGSFCASNTWDSSGISAGNDFRIGDDLNVDFITGNLDEIGIYNETFTLQQIQDRYNDGEGITFTTVYGTNPIVNLSSPTNASTFAVNYVTLECNGTDAESIKNLSLIYGEDIYSTVTNTTADQTDLNISQLIEGISYGVKNWSCIVGDWDNNIGTTETWFFNITAKAPEISLDFPTSNQIFNYTTININCSGTDDESIVNLTLVLDSVINETVTNSTSNQTLLTINKSIAGLTEATHTFSCKATDNISLQGSSANRDFVVDTIPPYVYSTGLIDVLTYSLPTSVTWGVNATDGGSGVDGCYYNWSDNSTFTYVTCNANTVTSIATAGNKSFYYCANDSAGNGNCTHKQIEVTAILVSDYATPNITAEGGNITFNIFINITPLALPETVVTLRINGSTYEVQADEQGSITNVTQVVGIPIGWGTTSGEIINYSWLYEITGYADQTTTSKDLRIYSMGVGNCTDYPFQILNFSLKDEGNNTFIDTNGTTTSLGLDLNISSKYDPSQSWNYNHLWSDINNVSICINNNVLNYTSYNIEFVSAYSTSSAVNEFYYTDCGTLDETNTINEFTTKEINLMDLDTDDSTSFIFNYFDENNLVVDDVVVHVFRRYIGEGLYREVERAKQDDEGDTVLHLVEEDVVYYFIISQCDDDLICQELFRSNDYTAKCQATPCLIQIEKSSDFIPFGSDWDLVDTGGFNIYYTSSSRQVNLTYSLNESSTMNLSVYKFLGNGTYELLSTGSSTGTTGSISTTIPQSAGNMSFFAVVYKDGDYIKSEWVDFNERAEDYIGVTLSLFLIALVVLCLGLIGITEGGVAIIFFIVGLVFSMVLGLATFVDSAGKGFLIYIILAGAVILFKLVRGKR